LTARLGLPWGEPVREIVGHSGRLTEDGEAGVK
jgi:hypothetical protein